MDNNAPTKYVLPEGVEVFTSDTWMAQPGKKVVWTEEDEKRLDEALAKYFMP